MINIIKESDSIIKFSINSPSTIIEETILSGASGKNSVTEGSYTTASGKNSHAEGFNTIASGDSAHAEGRGTTASGNHSRASGQDTTASGIGAEASGIQTMAVGDYARASGSETSASGNNSFSGGLKTVSSGENSFSFGNPLEFYEPGEFPHSIYDFCTGETENVGYVSLDSYLPNTVAVASDGNLWTRNDSTLTAYDADEVLDLMALGQTVLDANGDFFDDLVVQKTLNADLPALALPDYVGNGGGSSNDYDVIVGSKFYQIKFWVGGEGIRVRGTNLENGDIFINDVSLRFPNFTPYTYLYIENFAIVDDVFVYPIIGGMNQCQVLDFGNQTTRIQSVATSITDNFAYSDGVYFYFFNSDFEILRYDKTFSYSEVFSRPSLFDVQTFGQTCYSCRPDRVSLFTEHPTHQGYFMFPRIEFNGSNGSFSFLSFAWTNFETGDVIYETPNGYPLIETHPYSDEYRYVPNFGESDSDDYSLYSLNVSNIYFRNSDVSDFFFSTRSDTGVVMYSSSPSGSTLTFLSEALGDSSKSLGIGTVSIGVGSLAVGERTRSIGANSHAEGKRTLDLVTLKS